MILHSTAFRNGDRIPRKFTCDGVNMSPPLSWDDVPTNTKSLALVMYDPDSLVGTFMHWRVININPRAREIREDSVPQGSTQFRNGGEKIGYMGPCPYSGTHRYFFRLYALSTPSLSSTEELLFEDLEKYKLAEADLMGRYERREEMREEREELVTPAM